MSELTQQQVIVARVAATLAASIWRPDPFDLREMEEGWDQQVAVSSVRLASMIVAEAGDPRCLGCGHTQGEHDRWNLCPTNTPGVEQKFRSNV